jgi:hypothetical protein
MVGEITNATFEGRIVMEERSGAPRGGAQDETLNKALDDLVDEASMQSFPASDPPSFWARQSHTFSATRPTDEDASSGNGR